MKERVEITEDAHRQMASGGCFVPAMLMVLAVAVLLGLSGCCTCRKAVGQQTDKDSTGTHVELRRDTIKEVDSVYVAIREKGDTVYVEKYKYKYRYLTNKVTVTDTVVVSKMETVEVPVEVVKEVPRKRGWFEKTEVIGFWLLLALWGVKYRKKIMGIMGGLGKMG